MEGGGEKEKETGEEAAASDVNQESPTSLLVEEGVAWFQEIRRISKEKVTCPLDLFSLLLHGFMLELGFTGQEQGGGLPVGWRGARGHVTRYSLSCQQDTTSVTLTVTTLGPVIKVHGTHPAQRSCYSSSRLAPRDFIIQSEPAELDCEPKMDTRNLRQLARIFKNDIGCRLLTSARAALGLPLVGLQALPPELLLPLLTLLPLPSLLNLSATCSHLNISCSQDPVWRRLFLRTFGKRRRDHREAGQETWREKFRSEWLTVEQLRLERSRLQEVQPPSPLYPFPDPSPFHPLGPPVPGLLGGDYDRFPGGLPLLPGGLLPGGLLPPGGLFRPSLPGPRFDPPGPGRGGFLPPGFGGGFGGGAGFL